MVAPAEASLIGRYPVDRMEAAPVYHDIYMSIELHEKQKAQRSVHHYEKGDVSPANLPEIRKCTVDERPAKS